MVSQFFSAKIATSKLLFRHSVQRTSTVVITFIFIYTTLDGIFLGVILGLSAIMRKQTVAGNFL